MDMEHLRREDPEIFDLIAREQRRQNTTIELIASENFCSEAAREAVGSILCNKYTEGYPGGRYYGGCENYDELERLCQTRWKRVFSCEGSYHCNVQPHSGAQANFAAYLAAVQPGDTVLSMSLSNGAHLTHGSPVNFSGKLYRMVFYGVDSRGYIDMEDVRRKAREHRPKLIICGASAYSRFIDFAAFGEIAREMGALLWCDMAHIAGLVATGYHPTPFGHADMITTTTHKTLRTTRGGLIFCRPELARKVDSAVFPGAQGGSLMHVIAGKAVGAQECLKPEYKEYIGHVVENTRAMCEEFQAMGYRAVTGGTDNHLFLLDLSALGITGLAVQDACDRHGITLNKNCVPGDRQGPKYTSGIRIGCAAMTTKGFTKEQFCATAHRIDEIIHTEVMVSP